MKPAVLATWRAAKTLGPSGPSASRMPQMRAIYAIQFFIIEILVIFHTLFLSP